MFEKTRSINAIKFNSFQRKLTNTLSYASMKQQGCLLFINHQYDIKKVIDNENNKKYRQNLKIK